MARHANMSWNLPEGGSPKIGGVGRIHEWEAIHAAILMDIRDELQRLNAVFNCTNFLTMPRELRGLRRDLKKHLKEGK